MTSSELDGPPGPDPRREAPTYVGRWALTLVVPILLQLTLSTVAAGARPFGSPLGLFWLVLVAASGCALAATAVIVRAYRRREAELGYTGLFFMTVSVLPLVHGITTPGVWYGPNTTTMSSVQWSIPVATVMVAPLLLPVGRSWFTTRLAVAWIGSGLAALATIAAVMLGWTELVPMFAPTSVGAIAVSAYCVVCCFLLGRRHLYLAQVAGTPLPLLVSVGYGFVGASSLVWFGAEPFSIGFWLAHALDIVGVFAGTLGALVSLRRTDRVRNVIDPVLAADPLAALELGLDPIVHRFVADLEAYDSITRDHVVRTAELAVCIGEELGISGRALRQLGLAALLHDVGKMAIPPEIVNKPGKLDDDEYRIMQTHVIEGQRLVATSPALADIGELIRGHHERIDGRGYPDGLPGPEIPLPARIVSVCDAFDAMANTRQYRAGMGVDRAVAILREHAGTQWDADVVAAAVTVIGHTEPTTSPALDRVGRPENGDLDQPEAVIGCDCLPEQALV